MVSFSLNFKADRASFVVLLAIQPEIVILSKVSIPFHVFLDSKAVLSVTESSDAQRGGDDDDVTHTLRNVQAEREAAKTKKTLIPKPKRKVVKFQNRNPD